MSNQSQNLHSEEIPSELEEEREILVYAVVEGEGMEFRLRIPRSLGGRRYRNSTISFTLRDVQEGDGRRLQLSAHQREEVAPTREEEDERVERMQADMGPHF